MISINEKGDVLLIDFSYFFIYRYYALHSWFKMSETEYDEELFLTKYKRLFIINLDKIIKRFKIKKENVILAGDCSRCNIWRMCIYPGYKENREKMYEKSPINPKIFPIIYDDIVPSLKLKGIQYISLDKMEADDIIYGITRKLNNNITILTNDNDYLQMVCDQINIVNLPSFKSINKRGLGCPYKDLMCKILCGDSSDNIHGIIGKKQALKLIENDILHIEEYILEKGLMDKYNMNKQLIDMSNIPQELLDTIIIERYNYS